MSGCRLNPVYDLVLDGRPPTPDPPDVSQWGLCKCETPVVHAELDGNRFVGELVDGAPCAYGRHWTVRQHKCAAYTRGSAWRPRSVAASQP